MIAEVGILPEIDTFNKSLERCLSDPEFIPRFYERFLASSEDVRRLFALTNFPDQEKRLARSLQVLGAAMQGDMAAVRHLNARAESHDRRHMDIRPDLYLLWEDALTKTASEVDPEWDDHVAESWKVVLIHAIHFMVKRY